MAKDDARTTREVGGSDMSPSELPEIVQALERAHAPPSFWRDFYHAIKPLESLKGNPDPALFSEIINCVRTNVRQGVATLNAGAGSTR